MIRRLFFFTILSFFLLIASCWPRATVSFLSSKKINPPKQKTGIDLKSSFYDLLRRRTSPILAQEGFEDNDIFTFFGNNLVTSYNLQQLQDLRDSRGGTTPIPVTIRITPEGLNQNPNLINDLETYSQNLHLQINYQLDFWHSASSEEVQKLIPDLKKITTPGNTLTLGVEYHFFYDLSTYPAFVREIIRAGVTAPLITTNFNITNPSGPNGPEGNYMYSFEDSINYLAKTCPECLTSMSEIAISNYQDTPEAWLAEVRRVREILKSVGLDLENKPLKIVEAGPDPNKGSFEERVNKAIVLANQLTEYFKSNPDELQKLNLSGITFLIHDASTGKIALLVMDSNGQWKILYFFSGLGPLQYKGITLAKQNHPAPPFTYVKNILAAGLSGLFGNTFQVIFKHDPPESKVTTLSPVFQKISQAFSVLTPKSLKPKLTFDDPQKADQLKITYTVCENKDVTINGGETFETQTGLPHYTGKSLFLSQMLANQSFNNQNPNREENNYQVVGSEGEPPVVAQCAGLDEFSTKPHTEASTGQTELSGLAGFFAKFLESVEEILAGGLKFITDKVEVKVIGQSNLTSAYHQPQAESYETTMKTFIPKGVNIQEGCSTAKNKVKIEVGGLFSGASGKVEADSCSPKGEEEIKTHDTSMKFLLPSNLSSQYHSPWEE